jgi:hypothetical protein
VVVVSFVVVGVVVVVVVAGFEEEAESVGMFTVPGAGRELIVRVGGGGVEESCGSWRSSFEFLRLVFSEESPELVSFPSSSSEREEVEYLFSGCGSR